MNQTKNFHIAGKIPPAHYIALQQIQNATGLTQSRLLREAIALYLKKAKIVTVFHSTIAAVTRLRPLA
ncbi:ribbon-helix-helix domain-containing protein [Phormidium sp. CLA17]|nr:ribbon-helix-helix domain-containing protein [Leptolyngbya sp. Cla-17]MBM0744287.1 ribbon-helix-helix domain-containing protein [Leptolyngbya sp. Cla-17]